MTFLKDDPRPCETLNKLALDHFELVWATLVRQRSPNAFKMGCFGIENWVKKGVFPKLILGHLGCSNG